MIYGEPGSGKTSLAASAQDHPKMKDVLMINVEGGLLSVAHRGDIQAVDVNSTEEVEEIYWQLVTNKSEKKGEFKDVRTVVLDNGTEMQSMNLQEIVGEAIANGREDTKRNDIERDDYGKSTNQLKRIFRQFRQFPVNFIITAHEKLVYPRTPKGMVLPNAEPTACIPALTAALGAAVLGFVDFVWYLHFDPGGVNDEGQTVEPTYNMLTRTEGIYYAKTRGPRFRKALGQYRVLPEEGALPQIYDIYLKSTAAKKVA
jgi:hypothetical protein